MNKVGAEVRPMTTEEALQYLGGEARNDTKHGDACRRIAAKIKGSGITEGEQV